MTEHDHASDAADPLIELALQCQSDYRAWAAEQAPVAQQLRAASYRTSLEALWASLAPDLQSVAHGWIHSGIAPDIESLAMNMFTYIVFKLPGLSIDPQRNVRGLLVTIARRGMTDEYRRSYAVSPKRKPGRTVSLDDQVDLIDTGSADSAAETDHRIDRSAVLDAVWSYWSSSLDQDDMKIMRLRWQADPPCSFRDIAREMGVGWAEDAVRQRHHRIMNATRRHLHERKLIDEHSNF